MIVTLFNGIIFTRSSMYIKGLKQPFVALSSICQEVRDSPVQNNVFLHLDLLKKQIYQRHEENTSTSSFYDNFS